MTPPKTVAIVQARHSATRFPGKVLTEVCGQTLLSMLTGQLQRANRIDEIVLATTGSPADDKIAASARALGLTVYRGSEHDVLDRYYRAAERAQATTIVRVTADCPLLDPAVVDLVVDEFARHSCDYAANTAPPPGKFPDGMDVEVFTMDALREIWEEARAGDHREHVTFALWQNPDRFRIHQVDWDQDWSDVRATVDYPEDLEAVRAVLESEAGSIPPVARIVEILRAHYADASRGHVQGEGWAAGPPDLTSGKPAPALVTDQGDALFTQATKWIPGGAQTFSKNPLQYVKGTAPQVLVRGNGSRVWDADGNEFLDYVLGLGPAILGHCHPEVNAAAARCAAESFLTPSLPHPLEAQLAETVCRLVPCAEMVRFGKNGSDVTAGAARIARAVTGKDVIACSGYHGWQDWYIGSTTRNLGVPSATSELTQAFPYGELQALEDLLHAGNVAGVILEPVSLTPPPTGYLEGVRSLCTKYGALLIFDEVITGFRIHLGGAQSLYGVTPDLTALGKGIANGHPLAVLCGKSEYMAVLEEAFFSFTFGGELPSIAAAIQTIEIMEREHTPTRLTALGRQLRIGIDEVARTSGCAVLSSIGMDYFPGYSLKATDENTALELQTLFQQELVRRGVLTRSCFFLSSAHSTCDLDRTLQAMLGAARVLQTAITEGTVCERIDGELIEPVFRAAEKVNEGPTINDDPQQQDGQGAIFLQGEGDRWFLRKREELILFDAEQDLATALLRKHDVAPTRILEIGASNGYRLAALRDLFHCAVQGTDASALAVADGQQRYGVELTRQPAQDFGGLGTCDLLLLHFILHWVDRAQLPRLTDSVCEALSIGGFLLIADFAPDRDEDVPYHHLPPGSATTYKRDYRAHFLQTGCFREVACTHADHRTGLPGNDIPSAERMGFWLLERVG